MPLSQSKRADFWAITAIVILFAILSVPGDWVLALENWLKALINMPQRPPTPGWFPADKVVHVMLFLITALPVTLAIRARVRRHYQAPQPEQGQSVSAEKTRLRLDQVGTTAFILMLILGVLTEWIQSFIPGRSADPMDLVADLVGSVLGIALAYLLAPTASSATSSTR